MIYWDLIAATGWTIEYIDEQMTLPRLYAITEKWGIAPPVHRLIADYMGVKREQAVGAANVTEQAESKNDWDALRGVMGITVKG